MTPYCLLIGIPIILSAFRYNSNKKIFNPRFPLLIFFIIFIIMLSLRSVKCGADILNYKNQFDLVQSTSFGSLFDFSLREQGYNIFISISKLFTDNFQFFLILCAIVSVVPIMILYINESTHNVLTIALFIGIAPFSMFFSGLRQSIAIGLGAICYYFCKKNKIVPFLLFVVLAFLFHQSAVMLLLLYPLTHFRITQKWIFPLTILFVVFMIYNKQIFGILLGLNSKYESNYIISDTGSYTFLVLLILLTIYAFVIPEESPDLVGLRNILVISAFIQCFAPINTVAMRLNYYFLIFIPLLIQKVIDHAKKKHGQIASISSILFICFFVFWFFKEAYVGDDFLQIFPYIPFWDGTVI